jgi:hypothetical protein
MLPELAAKTPIEKERLMIMEAIMRKKIFTFQRILNNT